MQNNYNKKMPMQKLTGQKHHQEVRPEIEENDEE